MLKGGFKFNKLCLTTTLVVQLHGNFRYFSISIL